jgi:hypothetical protein
MGRLSDRMLRADVFSDGRLLRVSPGARLLAIALEALAESTGVVRMDGDEIRSAAGLFLADADSMPSREDVQRWCDELLSVRWALEFSSGGMRLLYLQGFGRRQTGLNVCVGAESVNGGPKPHLPMPACVSLSPREETVKGTNAVQVRKYLPRHCDLDHTNCPCESYPNGSPTLAQAMPKGSATLAEALPKGDKNQSELSQCDLNECDAKECESIGGEPGEPAPRLADALSRLWERYPAMNRSALSRRLFELSVQFGDPATIDAVDRTLGHNPKSPLRYLETVLSNDRGAVTPRQGG